MRQPRRVALLPWSCQSFKHGRLSAYDRNRLGAKKPIWLARSTAL